MYLPVCGHVLHHLMGSNRSKNTYIPGLITNLSPNEKWSCMLLLPPYWKHLISALDFLPRREEEGGSSWGKNWYVFAARQHFYGLSLKELNFRQEAVIKSSLTQSKVLAIGKRKQNFLDYVVSHIIRFSGNWILFFCLKSVTGSVIQATG